MLVFHETALQVFYIMHKGNPKLITNGPIIDVSSGQEVTKLLVRPD